MRNFITLLEIIVLYGLIAIVGFGIMERGDFFLGLFLMLGGFFMVGEFFRWIGRKNRKKDHELSLNN